MVEREFKMRKGKYTAVGGQRRSKRGKRQEGKEGGCWVTSRQINDRR